MKALRSFKTSDNIHSTTRRPLQKAQNPQVWCFWYSVGTRVVRRSWLRWRDVKMRSWHF